ncbi:MAG: F0F1 ATP synthase subunit B [Betaproteobacteria bacterium]|nr:F0F1 ATP synthase subunit B [Betaproteobacteria bacterium]
MDINATLIGQTIMFIVFVWFCMRFIWPPITQALEARRQQIADGLAQAERGKHDLELAAKRAGQVLTDARQQASEILAQAERRATHIIEEAKGHARVEGERVLAASRAELEQQIYRAKEDLRQHVAELAVSGAEKILRREIDARAHADLLSTIQDQL